eukprot:TRINITY_DN5916_c0_g1_i11.p2 TRINITY_DN5916_c0_g1~~TRINITY_DN5916_c0_g1_i11.p2  ORF type:complete len:122 (-),score=7.99 TRINITY_DN5916_c0_g1_i11:47-412(-)
MVYIQIYIFFLTKMFILIHKNMSGQKLNIITQQNKIKHIIFFLNIYINLNTDIIKQRQSFRVNLQFSLSFFRTFFFVFLFNLNQWFINCLCIFFTTSQTESHVLCVDTCLLYTSPSPRDQA